MKKIYILAAACLMAFAGCDNKEVVNVPVDGVRMTLVTDCAELITRATEPGVDALNENLIDDIHYYFFDKTTKAYIADGTQKIGNKTGTADFYLEGMDATIFNGIFSSRTEVQVYVVANATSPTGSTTLAAIKATALALTGHGKQSKFVMTGEGTLTKNGTNSAATDEIKLKRVASKITLHLTIPNSYKDLAGKEWEPQLGQVLIDFKNIEEDGLVGATIPTGTLDFVDVNRKATSTPSDFKLIPDESSTHLSLDVPVYSYPRTWENGDAGTPYIYITVPWKIKDSTADPSDTYYKILLPGNSLEPNSWYDITAKVGGLGSLVKEGTTTINDLSINVSKDWKDAIPGTDNNTDADLALPRVLAVEQNKYIIYNQNELEIPFVSSHNCETVLDGSITYSRPNTMGGTTYAQNEVKYDVDNEKRVIKFKHVLDNDQSTLPYDYQVFKMKIILKHTDDANFKETIEIEQRPALCVEAFNNADGFRNVFVNGTQETGTGSAFNPHTWAILRGSTSNTNVLQVTASVLGGGFSDYKIGDPRIRTNVLSSAPFSTVPGTTFNYRGTNYTQPGFVTDFNNKSLTYYYTAGSETSDIIAPSFRISSSFGGTGGENFDTNTLPYFQLRCAGYQEAGYPAGRWRLPTDAELKYCLQLQADGCLGDGIFNDSGNANPTYYISASGNFYGIKTVGGVKSIAGPVTSGTNIRCVYDAWYWDNTAFPRLDDDEYLYSECGTTNDNYKFIWGDAQISW